MDDKIPSKGFLLLDDWKSDPMTMADLRDNRSALESSAEFLACLVCLLDKCIYPVSRVQLAGFRHVVGTLWEISDWYCVQVTKKFYKALLPDNEGEDKTKSEFTDDDVCCSPHLAVLVLRDGIFEQKSTGQSKTEAS